MKQKKKTSPGSGLTSPEQKKKKGKFDAEQIMIIIKTDNNTK